MNRIEWLTLATLLLVPAAATHAADGKDLGDYLADIGPGPVAANEIIGLAGTAVSNVQTPKDLVVALNSATDSKAGFGIAFTPGRSGFEPLAVSVARYAADGGNQLQRIWANTTFSYAQNKKTQAGTDYSQDAFAVRVVYSLEHDADPAVKAYRKLTTGCTAADQAEQGRQRFKNAELSKAQALKPPGQFLSLQERSEIEARVDKMDVKTLPDYLPLRQKCLDEATKEAAVPRWNASQLGLTLGQGWVKSPTADGSRLSLGRHVSLAVAYGVSSQSLINLTLRRVDRELDLKTIGATPVYKKSTVAALRYTYGHGDGRDLYGIAEVSNVKAGTPTEFNAAFKYAVGVDHKIADGVWLEVRFGRSRTIDGDKLENKALFNLKLSPKATLPKTIAAAT